MKLFFICGALRSGTSLLHLMLDAHPAITNPGEFDFLFDGLTELGQEPSVEQYAGFLIKSRIFNSKPININPACTDYHQLINDLVSQLDGSGILCLNIHRNFDWAQYYFPDAKFVHILRDPRDVAKSTIRMGWAGNTYNAVDHWMESEKSWDRLVRRGNPASFFQFRYEDLIGDLSGTLTALCYFLNTEYDSKMLRYHENSTYSPPDISLTQQWKRLQTPREIELVEIKASGLIQARGYELSAGDPRPPNFYERLSLMFANRIYRYRFSIRRYGLLLSIAQRLTAAFPMLPGADWCRQRVHLIQISHLK